MLKDPASWAAAGLVQLSPLAHSEVVCLWNATFLGDIGLFDGETVPFSSSLAWPGCSFQNHLRLRLQGKGA